APTEAGERMLRALGPALDAIAEALASVRELSEKPAGTIRITTSEHAAHAVSWPECGSASRSPRTWSPCASGRTCAWRSWGRQFTSRRIQNRERRRIWLG